MFIAKETEGPGTLFPCESELGGMRRVCNGELKRTCAADRRM
jgi:hypothetical protein